MGPCDGNERPKFVRPYCRARSMELVERGGAPSERAHLPGTVLARHICSGYPPASSRVRWKSHEARRVKAFSHAPEEPSRRGLDHYYPPLPRSVSSRPPWAAARRFLEKPSPDFMAFRPRAMVNHALLASVRPLGLSGLFACVRVEVCGASAAIGSVGLFGSRSR